MPHAEDKLGQSIPADTPHAVSVTLPTWRANVGYEEGEDWVVSRMTTGYPRFFINKIIAGFADEIARKHGLPDEQAMLFPSSAAAGRCLDFIRLHCSGGNASTSRVIEFGATSGEAREAFGNLLNVSTVLFHHQCFSAAKTFWQHTGEGVSSRRAEFCKQMYDKGFIAESTVAETLGRQRRGPRRYRKEGSNATNPGHSEVAPNDTIGSGDESLDRARFVEERFGRNLNLDLADEAKQCIRRRIAGSLTADASPEKALRMTADMTRMRDVSGFTPEDVLLYPCGMNAIFQTHLRMLAINKEQRKSICFGFPYIDSLKLLEKFGPGCLFYGNGVSDDLDDLESRLRRGERYLSLFCEFPSNPLLRTPNLQRIRALADQYDFSVIVDETIGNFLNVSILSFADVLVSSLTKIFSGDSNVMGGCAIINPQSSRHALIRDALCYEDFYWPEDAIVMERNSRDFVSRIDRINVNAEAICEVLQAHSRVKEVFYPKINPSRKYYDQCRKPGAGYGGLLSATFYSTEDAAAFYDRLDTEKGPSLGTNFTLASPFVVLAHYTELDWAAKFGVDKNLIRFSVGLEDTVGLRRTVARALEALS